METLTNILVTVILLILTYLIYNFLFGSRNYWSTRGIPNVPGVLPIFGNTLSVFRQKQNLATFGKKIYENNRDKSMIGFDNMNKPTLLLRDPNLIKTVLQSSFNNFQNNEHMMDLDVDPLIGRDVAFVRGQEWKDSRTIFVTAFSAKRIKTMSLVVERVCEKLKNYLNEKINDKNSFELDAKFLFSRYTTEVAANSVFSIDGNSFEDDYAGTLLNAMKMTLDPSWKKSIAHNILFFQPGLNKYIKSSFVPSEVDNYFRKVVNDVEEHRKCDNKVLRNDVLQMMLDLERENKISREEAVAHVFSFFIESYETSSLTMSFIAYELGKHQKIQDDLRKEIETVLAKNENRLTYEAIQEMSYMEQVISESLRLFPPAGYMLKLCVEKYRLEGSDGLSVDVEPDTSILIPILGLHMDPEIWENPEKFDPERFRKGNYDDRRKFAYLPFGEGPRACPGSRLAMIQVKGAIATLLRNYRITLSPKMIDPARIDPRYFLITALGGFWIRLHPLKN